MKKRIFGAAEDKKKFPYITLTWAVGGGNRGVPSLVPAGQSALRGRRSPGRSFVAFPSFLAASRLLLASHEYTW